MWANQDKTTKCFSKCPSLSHYSSETTHRVKKKNIATLTVNILLYNIQNKFWSNEQWLEMTGPDWLMSCFKFIPVMCMNVSEKTFKVFFSFYSTTFWESLPTKFSWTANSKANLTLCLENNKMELRTDAAAVTILHMGKAALAAYNTALQLAWVMIRRNRTIQQKIPLSTCTHFNSNVIVVLHVYFYLVHLAVKSLWQQYR